MSASPRVPPNKWSQFSEDQLRPIVARLYPGFGEMQIDRLAKTALIELLNTAEKTSGAGRLP